jgi:beta-lactamase regulating signal transducer with metallopeptidase domain
MSPALHAIAQLLALRMVDSLVWGTAIVVFAGLLLRITRQDAGTRFAVWFSALIAIGLVPWIVGECRPSKLLSPTMGRAAITLPDGWAVYLGAAWALVAAWFVVGIGRALWHVYVLRRKCVEIDPALLDPVLQETLRRHGANRSVALCTSDQISVPTALGFFKPAIVVPSWVMSELSPSEVNQLLLHELAHLRRRDDWTNLVQQAIKATFFFHPAVWWIEKKVALEREIACDDAVVEETSSPRAYAECLAHLAEKSFLQRTVLLAQAALGKIRHTSLRVAEILKGNRMGRTRSWKPAVSMVAGFALACGLWSARVPDLVVFRNDSAVGGAQSGALSNFAQIQRVDTSVAEPVPVVKAKFVSNPESRKSPVKVRTAMARPVPSKAKAGNMVHLTAFKPDVMPFTETVFFVVEGSNSASPNVRVYQFQMFHVTILSAKPASSAPQKQT